MEPERLVFDVPATQTLAAHRLCCWQWGRADAAHTVFAMHGLTRNGRDFDYLAEALAADFRVLCPDMPGRGQSDWLTDPTAYNYGTYVSDTAWLLNHLNIPQVHWVGTSMGGIVAMIFAATFPGRIASAVLNDVGALVPGAGLKRIFSYAGKTEFDTRKIAEEQLRKNCSAFGIPDEAHWRHFFTNSIQDTPDGKARLAYDPAIAAAFPKPEDVADVDLSPWWNALKAVPVLLVRGATSDILPHAIAKQMQSEHPRLTLHEVPGAGHAPCLMDQKETALIHRWISTEIPL